MKTLVPRPYQQLMFDHMVEHDRGCLFAQMGLGKTSTSLMVIDALNCMDPCKTLVLAPKRVAQSTWPNEQKKWTNFRNLEVSPIVGSEADRKAGLRRDANVYTINYENIPWLVEQCGRNWPFRRVIADESTKLKNHRTRGGGLRAKALAKVAHSRVDYWTNLSGTPAPKGYVDLWGQLYFVDAGERLGYTFTAYKDRFFETVFEKVDRKGTVKHLREYPVTRIKQGAKEQIDRRIGDVCLSVLAKDWFDLREPIVNKIMIQLPEKVRKQYSDMEKKLYTEVKGEGIEAFNAAAKTGKCHQLVNGAAYIDPEVSDDFSQPSKSKKWVEVHDLKIQALESVLEEAGGTPVLVAYHFKSDLARILRNFPDARELDDDPRTVDDWNAGKIPILVAHPDSAGHGLNLQDGGNILCFFSLQWRMELHDQILERIGPVRQLQSGYDRPVFIHYIIAEDTVDEDMMFTIENDATVQEALMHGLSRRLA